MINQIHPKIEGDDYTIKPTDNLSSIRQGDQNRRKMLQEQQSLQQFQLLKKQSESEIDFELKSERIAQCPSKQQFNCLNQEQMLIDICPLSQSQKIQQLNQQEELQSHNKVRKKINSQVTNNVLFAQAKNVKMLNNIWKRFALPILHYIGRFIAKIKQYSEKFKFKQVSKEQFQIINDLSSNYQFYQRNQFVTQNEWYCCNKCKNMCAKISVFNWCLFSRNSKLFKIFSYLKSQFFTTIVPDSLVKYIWDFIILIFLISNIYFTTLDLAFLQYYEKDDVDLEDHHNIVFQVLFSYLPIGIMILDIYLNFITAFYDKGVLIKNKKLISKNYLKTRLFLDLVSCFLFITAEYKQILYLKLVLILKITQINKILDQFAEVFSLQDIKAAIFQLSKLILFILFIGHFCASAFFYLSRVEKAYFNVDQTWIEKLQIQFNDHNKWIDSYVSSYYWACITMITVGYGDIVPSNTVERAFVVIITLISCGVFAYTVNFIGTIIQSLAQKNVKFNKKMSHLSEFMKKRGLKIDLQMKVKKYFQYLHDEQSSNNDEQVQEMIRNNLASNLKNEVFTDIYGRILKSKKLFRLNFSEKFLNQLSLRMTEQKFGPEDVIYKENDLVNNIYFILNGDVTQVINIKKKDNEKLKIKELTPGSIFGEIEFFTERGAAFSTISKNVVTAAIISKQSFLEVAKDYQEDYQKFCMMRDNFIYNNSSRGMASQCSSCGQFTHQFLQCPFINFIPYKEQIIQKLNSMSEENRQHYDRSNGRLLNSLTNIEMLKESALQYLINNYEGEDIEPLMQCLENINLAHGQLSKYNDSNKCIKQSPQQSHQQPIQEVQQFFKTIENNQNKNNSQLDCISPKQIEQLQQNDQKQTVIRNQRFKRRTLIHSNERRASIIQPLLLEELNKVQSQLHQSQQIINIDNESENNIRKISQQFKQNNLINEEEKQFTPKNNLKNRQMQGSLAAIDEEYELKNKQNLNTSIVLHQTNGSISLQNINYNTSLPINNTEQNNQNNIIQQIQNINTLEKKELNHIRPDDKPQGGSGGGDQLQQQNQQNLDINDYSFNKNQDLLSINSKKSDINQKKGQNDTITFMKFTDINDFDCMYNWLNYFVYNNPNVILMRVNQTLKKQPQNVYLKKKQKLLDELHSKYKEQTINNGSKKTSLIKNQLMKKRQHTYQKNNEKGLIFDEQIQNYKSNEN